MDPTVAPFPPPTFPLRAIAPKLILDFTNSHKRTRAGLARTLLHRVSSSKGDPRERDESPSPTNTSPLSATHSQLAIETPPAQPSSSVKSPSQGPASIEQSVRLFRVFEALRNGDTTAISKAIREHSGPRGDSLDRTSTSTQGALDGTSILHLAVQCADLPVIEYVLSSAGSSIDINGRDKDGNTPLHVATHLSRVTVVRLLLEQPEVNDSLVNYQGRTPLDLAKNPDVFQQLQLAKSMYIDARTKDVHKLVASGQYDELENLLSDVHFQTALDVNSPELATDPSVTESGGTLLHEAAKKKDAKLIQTLLLNGADPFKRDRKGKLPQDYTKDDRTKAILKKSPAAAAAQRGIQEKTILGSGGPQALAGVATSENVLAGKEGREMKGYLKKWVNYTTGYKLRWFVLEDGVLSYYKHQDDAGSACRGAINMKIAKLHMDAQDKLRFEIIGKSSVKYHLKANHQVEAKRWFWALNNAIQHAKDEAKESEKAQTRKNDMLRQAKIAQAHGADRASVRDADAGSVASSQPASKIVPGSSAGILKAGRSPSVPDLGDEEDAVTSYDPSVAGDDVGKATLATDTTAIEGDIDADEEYGDDASEIEARPVNKDAFLIAAQSAKLQLDLLQSVSSALEKEKEQNPGLTLSEPSVSQALASYDAAVANLRGLIGDLGRIARDRDAYWQYRLEQEVNVRKVWEDSMMKVAKEQEELENKIGESEEKRKQTKRALKEVLEGQVTATEVEQHVRSSIDLSRGSPEPVADSGLLSPTGRSRIASVNLRKKSTITTIANMSDSESDNDEEFFDAVDAGEVEIVDEVLPTITSPKSSTRPPETSEIALQHSKQREIEPSYLGYEEPIRKRLKMDNDDRPKISLWGILKSMIGKDMTKMTLPVSFNEPTSLLQRVAEDMEYTDLLDLAADRSDSTERMVYVAAFAASEYASTIGRVAKPFNPLLGETYEYVRPDKGYRFFIEQVSHHPPIGAAWAESPKWDYYGESAVRSKFYGKSFDINPLGTWFLKLRPTSSSDGTKEELYTWKKVTSSVVGIITGSPTVDNYGPMEVRNHTTGEVCLLEFKQRSWKSSSAYQVAGKVVDRDGATRWSMGGRWNDKIYARLTPGFEGAAEPSAKGVDKDATNQAFLVWEAHARPTGIPFNLTPFVLTLNALTDSLQPRLPPTDTRLRPDQRAMEDGEYDFAATEKNRVEEKQRAKRRARESAGEEFVPRWFRKGIEPVTGERYWVARGSKEDVEERSKRGSVADGAVQVNGVEYWKSREAGDWSRCEDIF